MRQISHFRRAAVFTISIVAAGVFTCSTARAETVDRIVANVNGEIILYSEVQNQLTLIEKYTQNAELADPEKRKQAERDILDGLVREKLAEAEAKRLKIVVTDSEVEGTLNHIVEENHTTLPQFEVVLKAGGQTVDKFRDRIRKDLERNRLMDRTLKSKITISDKQVEDFLNSPDGSNLTASRRIRLGLIAFPVDKGGKPADIEKTGHEVLDKIKSGADFSDMARQYSKGVAAKEGGDIGYMAPDELAPFISQAIRGLQKGGVSDLVKGPGGFYILKVVDVETKKLDPTDPNSRERVRKYLFDKEVNRRFEEWVHDLESKAFIQISL